VKLFPLLATERNLLCGVVTGIEVRMVRLEGYQKDWEAKKAAFEVKVGAILNKLAEATAKVEAEDKALISHLAMYASAARSTPLCRSLALFLPSLTSCSVARLVVGAAQQTRVGEEACRAA
jgi:hypothetical protein